MKYNKKQQPYSILGRFRIFEAGKGEVEYCRIQFHTTGHVANIPAGIVKTDDFEDDSIKTTLEFKPEMSAPVTTLENKVVTDDITSIELDGEELIQAIKESDEAKEFYGDAEIEVEVKDDVIEVKPVQTTPEITMVAINPDGAEETFTDVQFFAEQHDLDPEAIEACLNGEQKTHKKWRFTTV